MLFLDVGGAFEARDVLAALHVNWTEYRYDTEEKVLYWKNGSTVVAEWHLPTKRLTVHIERKGL